VTPLTDLTLTEASSLLAAGQVSPVELTEAVLQRIAVVEDDIKAFATLTPDRALRDAKRAERELARRQRHGPLHGIPIVLKDLIATAGIATEAGSQVLKAWIPTETATVARRLEAAGTVLLGKATTHEFGMDVYTPPTRNPWDLQRIPGGSSGGSGAAGCGPGSLRRDRHRYSRIDQDPVRAVWSHRTETHLRAGQSSWRDPV